VLYEMLAGMPPFMAATPQATIAQRFTHPPEPLSRYRATVPAALEEIVRIAMATAPADRFTTARAFAEALAGTGLAHPTGRRVTAYETKVRIRARQPSRGRWRPLLIVATMVAIALLAYAVGSRLRDMPSAPTPAADTATLLVLPPELAPSTRGTVALELHERLYDAFRRWQGLSVIDAFRLDSAIRRDPTAIWERPSRLAQSVRAGRFVRTRVIPLHDSIALYAAIYDVASDRPLYQFSARASTVGALTAEDSTLRALADSLLLRGASLIPQFAGTQSLPAAQALVRAAAALSEWDLMAADSALQRARQYDARSPTVNYWLAQVRAWRGQQSALWREGAAVGASDTVALPAAIRPLTDGLKLLGQDKYAEACAAYERARAAGADEFSVWYGLALCRDFDHVVVRDGRSPSGWAFRSSYWRAMQAYERAFVALASGRTTLHFNAFGQLRDKLYTSATRLRSGYVGGEDDTPRRTMQFLAHPEADADSIRFVPLPADELRRATRSSTPASLGQAIQQGREALRRVALAWVMAMPQDAGAREALAVSLELLGERSSADTLRSARGLASTDSHRLALAVSEAIVRIKFGLPDDVRELEEGVQLSDSLRRAYVPDGRVPPRGLVALMALSGRCDLPDSWSDNLGPPGVSTDVADDAAALTVAAALGCRRGMDPNAVTNLARRISGASRDSVVRLAYGVLGRAISLRFPLDSDWLRSLGPNVDDYLLRAQRAFLAGDASSARTILTNVASSRAQPGTDQLTPDAALPEARLWLALRDTTKAEYVLDASLAALRTSSPGMLEDPIIAGSVPRVVALRARLALSRGDANAARRWGVVLQRLWQHADPALLRAADAADFGR
jgi:hypothetical protein